MSKIIFGFLFVTILVVGCMGGNGGLKMKYYKKQCPSVSVKVRDIVWSKVATNPAMAAKLLRLHYHDCFVRGCDGSILLDPVQNTTTEKTAGPNRSVSGYDVIDEIKTALEAECPGIVSCADILALAARDAVSFQVSYIICNTRLWIKD
ncbi:hypothetical protein L2E82_06682 [Cichorium intybus]|uniref:Uncharacterized protein n=1 Tax=Cichorium intybus TaxID=13427 RepID=A0ACB9HC06_CICIN|nr:hypothetical protein L2E82_06682 [Cichorium intybus]